MGVRLRDSRDMECLLLSAEKRRATEHLTIWPSPDSSVADMDLVRRVLDDSVRLNNLHMRRVGTVDAPFPILALSRRRSLVSSLQVNSR